MGELRKPDPEVELVVDAHAMLGEGPVWDPRVGQLLWTDILGRRVHRFDPVARIDVPVVVNQPVGCIAVREAGGHVAGVRDGFATLDVESGVVELLVPVEASATQNRMNDGKCDQLGRFWAGTMEDDGAIGEGSLYRLDVDHEVTQVMTGVTISNGLAWSADGGTMYYIDTGLERVDAFDVDPATGDFRRRGTVVEFEPADGRPDGMTIDSEGYLWVALAGGWCVRRYAVNGRLDGEVRVPARLVTSCTFGGPDLTDLYITTAGYDVGPGDQVQPNAGGLFRYRPGVHGLAADPYRG
jgi:sugar lactone lactonase YvrE